MKFRLLALPVFVLLLSAESALACSCVRGGPVCEEFGRASAVFVGTVTGVRPAPPPASEAEKKLAEVGLELRGFKFAVTESFVGAAGAEVEVWTGKGGGDCGYDFEQGASYLVYASRLEKGGRLATGYCSRTKSLADAAEDLELLRGLSGGPGGVNVSGTVTRVRRDLEGRVKGADRVGGASVVVEGGGERREVSTDEQGRYGLSGLRAGTYKVKLLLPDDQTVWRPEREVKVGDRGCAVADFLVLPNGRLSGVVTDDEGQPAARVRLTLVGADDPHLEGGLGKAAVTDADGRYAFSELPPGRYLLAVNLARFPEYGEPTHAFPRTYYPAAARAADAEVITLGEGEELRGRDLRLPPRRAERAVEFAAVWEDGRPAAFAFVSFKDVTHHDRGDPRGSMADAEGRFTLKGYEGQTFVVEAQAEPRGGGAAKRSDPLTVNLSGQQGPLRLVITKTR